MLKGLGVSDGIGIGNAVILYEEKPNAAKKPISNTEKELQRLKQAIKKSVSDTEKLVSEAETRIGRKETDILKGQILILNDSFFTDDITNTIKTEKVCGEYATELVCEKYIKTFSSMEDDLMSQRAADIKDIKNRLQRILMGIETVDISLLPKESILIAEELTPSATVKMNPKNVVGIVTECGGKTSHSAILARALEIPAVVGVTGIVAAVKNGDTVIADGFKGSVIINPDNKTNGEYHERQNLLRKRQESLKEYLGKPSRSADGRLFKVYANVGQSGDIAKAVENDAEGIGLYRTEFLFMGRTQVPPEDEQFNEYRKAAKAMDGKPVVIRTLDIGGDKNIPYLGLEKEKNPFLGYRGIRFCLGHPDIFRPQLRALLRASAYGNIRIMLPFITCLDEVRRTKEIVGGIMEELKREDIGYNESIKIGVMVETASASLIADILVNEVDFFSIGTNDLTQYTMSVDRGNKNVSYLYSHFQPAVLRSIRHVINCGKKSGICVGMCGEAAGDPFMIPLLMSFGLNEFSVSPPSVLKVRQNISQYSIKKAGNIADNVMSRKTFQEITGYINNEEETK